jgi:hypothetical protein
MPVTLIGVRVSVQDASAAYRRPQDAGPKIWVTSRTLTNCAATPPGRELAAQHQVQR